MSKPASISRWKAWISALSPSLWTCCTGSLCLALWLGSRAFLPPLSVAGLLALAALWALLAGFFGYFLCRDIERLMRWLKRWVGDAGAHASVGVGLALAGLVWWLGPLSPVYLKPLPVQTQIQVVREGFHQVERENPLYVQASDHAYQLPDETSSVVLEPEPGSNIVVEQAPSSEPVGEEELGLAAANEERPSDFAHELLQRGISLYERGELDEAIAVFNQVVALCTEAAHKDCRAELAASLCQRGLAQRAQARLPDVLHAYNQALGRHSGVKSLTFLDDLAIQDFDKAIGLYCQLVQQEGRRELAAQLAQCLNSRARISRDRGNLADSLRDFDHAAAVCEQGMEHDGQVDAQFELTRQLATSLAGRGNMLRAQNRLADAADELERAIAILERLHAATTDAALASELAVTLTDRAHILQDQGKVAEAANHFDRAVQLYTELVEQQGRTDLSYQFAATLLQRDTAVRDQGTIPETAQELDKAVSLYTTLVDRQGRAELRSELASSLARRAQILFAQGKAQCIADFNRAISLYMKLVNEEGQREPAGDLAKTLYLRGTALLNSGDANKSILDYDEAVALYRQLVEREGQHNKTIDLARLLNDRGNVLRAQARLPEAIQDLDQAVALCTRLVEEQGHREHTECLAMCLNNRAIALADQGKFTESLEDYNKAISLYTRLSEQAGPSELTSFLAASLNNRGVAWIRQRKPAEAVQDFEKAVELYDALVQQNHRPELTSGLSISLNTLAKIYCISTESGVRNSAKAIAYATRACELTEHQNSDMLNTLATAYAAVRDFHQAYYWQAKALQLAPKDPQGSAAKLEYYRLMKSRMR
jgi:tetratricopeptide (TPR) repeat protein